MLSLYLLLVVFLYNGSCSGRMINNVIKHVKPKLDEAAANLGVPWSYDRVAGKNGPDEWDALDANWTCDGTKQSPIDIVTAQVMETEPDPTNLKLRVEPEYAPITGELKNNGYAPTLTVGEEFTLKLTGGSLAEDYFLKQFHFHFGCNDSAGSEHSIDGNFYPVEMHLVFWDNGNFQRYEDAAQGENGLAVVSVLFEKENEMPAKTLNPAAGVGPKGQVSSMEKLIQLFAEIEIEGSTHMVTKSVNLHFNEMLPSLMSTDFADRFFTYQGSLTTPGCYESVKWFVMNSHPKITEPELTAFRQLKSSKAHKTGPNAGKMCNNIRPLQLPGGRQIHSNIVL